MTLGLRVRSLHRYPVKSMLGEQLERLELDTRGCVGDRAWSVRTAEGKIGSGKTTRRFADVPGLLGLRARELAGRVVVVLPDGTEAPVDDPATAELVSAHLGQPVTLARETTVSHFDDGPVSLAGVPSVAAVGRERGAPVAASRFRANVLLDTPGPFVEDSWVGARLRLGTAELAVDLRSTRCVMVDQASADLPEQHGNLLAVGRLNQACLGVIATVVRAGTVRVGDPVEIG